MSKRSKILDIAKKMPPKKHSVSERSFDITHSEVLQWMLQNRETWEYIWNNIKQSGSIVYDEKSGMWVGVDYGKTEK